MGVKVYVSMRVERGGGVLQALEAGASGGG